HWDDYGAPHIPDDTRRDGSHTEFYTDTLLLIFKHGLYIDALLAFITNTNTSGPSPGDTILRDTFALTSNYNIQLPHPLLGAIPLTIAVGLLVINGMEFLNYVIALLAAPLTWLPPSISPHSRPASSLKNEWPPLFDHPFRSTSLGEFWSKRWQGTPRRVFLVGGARPGKVVGMYVGQTVGQLGMFFSSRKANRHERMDRARSLGSRAGYVMGAFLVSGLMHDFGMWGMGQGMDFRRVTGYFLIQGAGVIIESMLGLGQTTSEEKIKKGSIVRQPPNLVLYRYLMKLWVFGWVVVPATMMIEAWLQRGFGLVILVPDAYSPSRAILNAWNNFAFGK
ncbi:hypothetical protein FRC07_003596, partial [Ceratobasidium sp. 392]